MKALFGRVLIVVHQSPIRSGAGSPEVQDIDRRLFVGGVDKGLQVLRAFYDRPTPLSLTDVAAATGMGRSAAQRFLYTLKALGYLRQNPSTRRYTLSPRVLDFGFAYLRNDSLVEKSFTYLLDASKRTDETVNLTELDGTEVIYVSRFPSRKVISVDIILGARLPIYCTAPGRAMLSQMAPSEAEAILARSNLIARTPFTEVAPARIMKRVAEARKLGYALSNQESYVGDISVASPVRDHTGRVLAAVNIAVPHPRWSLTAVEKELSPVVIETARAISKALGAS
jgi:IclR family transcriptional regulator, pca regulon regulatory protein